MSELLNPNFKSSIFWLRSAELVGGTEEQISRWWLTPIPYAPFNLRAPIELFSRTNVRDFNALKLWFSETTVGGSIIDVDYFEQDKTQDGTTSSFRNDLKQSTLLAIGGTESLFSRNQNLGTLINYKINTFTSSGDFFVRVGGPIDYLIVGGGGGGGGGYNSSFPVTNGSRTDGAGGGGGGGGVLFGSMFLPAGNYRITVGSGGTSGYDNLASPPFRQSSNGGDSVAFGLTALGGGAGSSAVITTTIFGVTAAAQTGSSGGGGGGSVEQAGATGYNGQGFGGGNRSATGLAGGGGGAGGVGGSGGVSRNDTAGDGGVGILSNITSVPTYYGGGGGGGAVNSNTIYGTTALTGGTFGGAGGIGGGGRAANVFPLGVAATNGTANTGGGGGGSTNGNSGGSGGSGIVIIRSAVTQNDLNNKYWHYPQGGGPTY